MAEEPNVSSQASQQSQTAQEYISSQLQLEADAREALPYQFDTCTKPLGPLRQELFSCLTCNPPPGDSDLPYTPAGFCYSCSISCHGEHELVELFSRRDFECDCGTTRLPSTSPCSLRINPQTGKKGDVTLEEPRQNNVYNQNFSNRFCGCSELYDPHQQKGTMFQCLGLGAVKDGGCGEDWWHPECVLGISQEWREKTTSTPKETEHQTNGAAPGTHATTTDTHPNGQTNGATELSTNSQGAACAEDYVDEDQLPPGFPVEDDFGYFICYKCVDAFPWIKKCAGATGFLPAVKHKAPEKALSNNQSHNNLIVQNGGSTSSSKKRNSDDARLHDGSDISGPDLKKIKETPPDDNQEQSQESTCKYETLPHASSDQISLFLQEDFRDHICRCPSCFPKLKHHPQLLEDEDTYEPPVSERSSGAGADGTTHSAGSRSLLDRGEAALSNMDRVRAIEGVMAYNHLRDKVKDFLKPFADSGQAVGADDVKKYFEQLRGDEQGIQEAGRDSTGNRGDGSGGEDDNRHEQSGY